MIIKNQKILSLEVSVDDLEGAIGRDFRVKKQDLYEAKDLESDEMVCLEELLKQLRIDATPRKEIKYQPRKERKPIARSTKPIARKPITRSTTQIARTPIAHKPIPWPPNKPFVQPKNKPYKKPKPGRNDIIDDEYSTWLGEQPCVITGQVADRGIGPYNTHCHHVRGRARGRRNDYNQVPLIGHLHTYADHSYHVLGKSEFLEKWKDHIPDSVDDIVEFFESCARVLKDQYDSETKLSHLITE